MSGCFIHWLTSRWPCGVRHLFSRLANEWAPLVSSGEPWRTQLRVCFNFFLYIVVKHGNLWALTNLVPVTDLEEVKSPHSSIVQPHVLTQVQSGETEGVEVGLIREEFEETHYCSQAWHSHLWMKPHLKILVLCFTYWTFVLFIILTLYM